jgi:tryptophanyl-tRNA synthetase
MRPTGKLHLGNYMGALANWVKLQDSAQYECYFFIADLHALTTDYADTSRLKLNTLDVALDYLAAGLNPNRSTIFIQSHVPQHAELHLLFSMITPLGWLERVPTYKEQQENLTGKDLSTYGFLGYPLLQAADILLYQPQFVPVGQDQVAHVELTREVARRFNSMYKSAIFPEPDALLTPSPKVPGTDGRKMSKSYGNTIGLTEAPLSAAAKIRSMSTGGQRIRQSDPGDPDLCPVGDIHKVFSATEIVAETQKGCRAASIRCELCKIEAAKSVCAITAPIHSKRMELESRIDDTWEMLRAQSAKAANRAEQTMVEVRAVLDLSRDLGAVKQYFGANETLEAGASASESTTQHWAHDFSSVLTVSWRTKTDAEQKKSIRIFWIQLVKRDVDLRFEQNRIFDSIEREIEEPAITTKGKRVFIDSACVAPTESLTLVWDFKIPPKSFEVWVLIAGNRVWDDRLYVDDFVIPQKYYAQTFAKAKKSLEKDVKIPLALRKDGDRFLLSIHGSEPVDITELRSNYEPLK